MFKKYTVLTLTLALLASILSACSIKYKNLRDSIFFASTPKEIFDLDEEIKTSNLSSVEARDLKKNLSTQGLEIFTNYTKAIKQGIVIPDRPFLERLEAFIVDYEPYSSSRKEKELFLDIYTTADTYLDRIKANQPAVNYK